MSWRWLLDRVVVAIHDEQITEHGGSTGVRDEALLSSAYWGMACFMAPKQPQEAVLAIPEHYHALLLSDCY